MTIRGVIARKRGCPDLAELRRLIEETTDSTRGSQLRLAELIGCGVSTLRRWERGAARPMAAHLERLRELEGALRARRQSINEELRQGPVISASTPAELPPLYATVLDVVVEGEQALLRFGLKVPGKAGSRLVAQVVLPAATVRSLRTNAAHGSTAGEVSSRM